MVIGDPIAHSKSPQLLNAAFQANILPVPVCRKSANGTSSCRINPRCGSLPSRTMQITETTEAEVVQAIAVRRRGRFLEVAQEARNALRRDRRRIGQTSDRMADVHGYL